MISNLRVLIMGQMHWC